MTPQTPDTGTAREHGLTHETPLGVPSPIGEEGV